MADISELTDEERRSYLKQDLYTQKQNINMTLTVELKAIMQILNQMDLNQSEHCQTEAAISVARTPSLWIAESEESQKVTENNANQAATTTNLSQNSNTPPVTTDMHIDHHLDTNSEKDILTTNFKQNSDPIVEEPDYVDDYDEDEDIEDKVVKSTKYQTKVQSVGQQKSKKAQANQSKQRGRDKPKKTVKSFSFADMLASARKKKALEEKNVK